ncbi:MAG: hypothetical protein JOZ07_17785 [Solirubrobacterales bacterium]|nr:hypothetical protein [Solirubrobacterales bacterium]
MSTAMSATNSSLTRAHACTTVEARSVWLPSTEITCARRVARIIVWAMCASERSTRSRRAASL